ncbi:MAG: choice-of-anchor D domain-containing protein [Ignavibacteriaceae bacterium]|nr:choice-of-anchor D domain-containing protein [Ignavibacteriaceae bacterium]
MKKILLICIAFIPFLIQAQTLIEVIDLPTGNYWNYGYGMVYENNRYWISSSHSPSGKGIFFAVNSSGNLIDTLDILYPSMRESQGLAFDGTYFWYIERKTARCEIFKVDQAGNVLDSITSSNLGGSLYIGGAAWDGTGLWFSVYSPNASVALYKVNVSTKQIIDTISVFGLQPMGIAVKGDTLFYVMDGFENDPEKIYAIDLATEDTLFSWHVPEQPGVRQNPRGLAWDGQYFWLLAEPVGSSSGRQLFKYSLSGSGNPSINLLTNSINFGNVLIDSTSTQFLGINNFGSADLIIDSMRFSNSVFYTNVPFPISISPGLTVNIPIKFTPYANVVYDDSVQIFHNDLNYEYSKVTLSGKGVYTAPYLALSSASIFFGDKRINSTSYKELTLINAGSEPLLIDSISLNTSNFSLQFFTAPLTLDSLEESVFRIWFNPDNTGNYFDSLMIYSNASNGSLIYVPLSGNGVTVDPVLGNVFWQGQVPPNPATSYQNYQVRAMTLMDDINLDGEEDLIVCSANYWVLAFNGNSSGTGDILWKFSTYGSNNDAGSVEWVQNLQIAADLNGDNFNDVVAGTTGGGESVFAIDGKTGIKIWEFGDPVNYNNGDIMGVDVKRDFNNDGVPDVLASASGNESTGEGRFSVYLLNGLNGSEIWRINQAPEQKLKYMITSTDDGGAVGSRVGTNNQVIGFNKTGSIIWTYSTSGSPWTVREISNIGGALTSDVIVGTTTGNVYALAGNNGSLIWSTNIGNVFIEDLRIVPDVNNSGTPDILVSGINPNIFMLEGSTGSVIWQNNTGGNILGVGSVGDLNADGIPEVGSASLNNLLHIYESKLGSILFTYSFGGGGNSTAAEHVNKMADIDDNLSNEFAGACRDGRVVAFSGGTDVIPVELVSLSAGIIGNDVELKWSTASETNNRGFEIQRLSINHKVKQWHNVGFVEGSGTSINNNSYTFIDRNLTPGAYSYRIKQIDLDGRFNYTGEIAVEIGIPVKFALEQNYPNPFNPSTKINYSIPKESDVKLTVYDLLGREIYTLVDDIQKPGYYEVEWKGLNSSQIPVTSGTYFFRLQAGSYSAVKKMLLLR